MTPASALQLDRVWKRFRRASAPDSLRDALPQALARWMGRPIHRPDRHFWAVSDVSFGIPRGQCCGIIGPNGAGKSTLLKLLSRILRPNRGAIQVNGRVSSLIEVGAGFHPDLTGRENIQLNASILGLSRREVRDRFDRIVDFAELHDFLDMPLKHYSSGMQARLGFAVAAHVDPDILLVDEVLSVGDMSFQNRCLDRIAQFRKDGATIILVSHNLRSIAQSCDRVIVLKQGRIISDDAPSTAINSYIQATIDGQSSKHGGSVAPKAEMFDVRLSDDRGCGVDHVAPGQPLRLEFRCRMLTTVRNVTFGFFVTRASDRLYAYGANTTELGFAPLNGEAGEIIELALEFRANLTRGLYLLGLHAKDLRDQTYLVHQPNAALLDVREQVSYDGVADLGVSVRHSFRPSSPSHPEPGPLKVELIGSAS